MSIRNLLIKLLRGHTASEMERSRRSEKALSDKVHAPEPYKEFVESIQHYVGNYPAWKAQSEYRESMRDNGFPLSGVYPSGDRSYPTHAESVDLYLGRVVDGFKKLRDKIHNPDFGTHWESEKQLSSARGDHYLQKE